MQGLALHPHSTYKRTDYVQIQGFDETGGGKAAE